MAPQRTASPPASGSSRINVGTNERVASVAGGALLTYLGLKKFSLTRLGLAATGGALLFRGLTGFCPVNAELGRDTSEPSQGVEPIHVDVSLTVQQPRGEVYAFWRELENLPRFMHHLDAVRAVDATHSYWSARLPGDAGTLEWNAEITVDEEGRRIAWRSVPGAPVDNAGEVCFDDAPGGRGTEVHAHISYRPPAGAAGRGLSNLLNPVFEQMVKEDVRRFKHILEAGEVPTSRSEPSGS